MRLLSTAGVIITASLVACSSPHASPLVPDAAILPGGTGPPPACIHVTPGDGIDASCGEDEPVVEGAPPSVYVDGQSVSEPQP